MVGSEVVGNKVGENVGGLMVGDTVGPAVGGQTPQRTGHDAASCKSRQEATAVSRKLARQKGGSGLPLHVPVGLFEGDDEGNLVGEVDGASVGWLTVGALVGDVDGNSVGLLEVGMIEGDRVGLFDDGDSVGD